MVSEMLLGVELRLLTYSAFLCLMLWLPYILAGFMTFGIVRMVSYPAVNYAELPQWALRLYRAHLNLVENIAPFAVLVIVAVLTNSTNEATALGARLFFWMRVAQVVFHTAGIPWGRTVTYLVGWAGNLIIFWQIVS